MAALRIVAEALIQGPRELLEPSPPGIRRSVASTGPETGPRILIVDDDPGVLKTVRTNLARHGYQVRAAKTGREALRSYEEWHPDLVLLEIGLPDIDGTDVIREIRAHANTPILVLSVLDSEREKVATLDLGADDYLTKPFGVKELVARIRLALRRAPQRSSGGTSVFKTGKLEVDFERHRVRVAGDQVHLTPTEYDMLRVFIEHPDQVLTNRMLLRAVWGREYESKAHYVHVYVERLRQKVEADPQRPRYLLTEAGMGYRFVAGEE